MNIIVTGASKGIGFELCKIFAKLDEVKQIIAIARDKKLLSRLKSDKIRLLQLDINDLINDKPKTFLLDIKLNKVDILINNAGYLINKPFNDISSKEAEQIFRTNYHAPAKIISLLFPLLKKSKQAHIVNVSSMGGYQGSSKFAGLSHYSASKAAIAILSECLAEEYKDTNIKVNCLALGAVQTEMLENAFPGYKAPLKASEMAHFIVDFAINGSKYINGKIIPVSLSTP